MKNGMMKAGMPARSNAGGALRGADRAAAVKAMNATRPAGGMGGGAGKPAGAGRPVAMAKGGAVPMKKMAAFERSAMDMKEDKAGMKKMAGKAMSKGKKMMPAFMKKGARGK